MPIFIIALLLLIILIANIKIVPQAHSYIIERFGGYFTT